MGFSPPVGQPLCLEIRPPASTGRRLHRPLALEDGARCPQITSTEPLLLVTENVGFRVPARPLALFVLVPGRSFAPCPLVLSGPLSPGHGGKVHKRNELCIWNSFP